jgi:hypothetical protein
MNANNLFIETLKNRYPKTYSDICDFYKGQHPSYDFNLLPFSAQAGVMIFYFNDCGIDLDLHDTSITHLETIFEEAFQIQENNISHYS